MTKSCDGGREAGFSLVELMVALVVTLMISGAVFGLMAGGQNAFRREPALTDRQQNIRAAMSMIEKDVAQAGTGLGKFAQVFSDNLNSVGTSASTIKAGQQTDILEVFLSVENCPELPLCRPPGSAASVSTYSLLPSCMQIPGMVAVYDAAGHSYIRWACQPASGTSNSCQGGPGGGPGDVNGHAVFPQGQGPQGCTVPGQSCNQAGGLGTLDLPAWLSGIAVMRYFIQVDDGVPNLYRSPIGGVTNPPTSGVCSNPAITSDTAKQLVARGIEDLQVGYKTGLTNPSPTVWDDTPGLAEDGNINKVVRRVQITVSARALETRLAGEMGGANNAAVAVRGRLVAEVNPRAATATLQDANLIK